MGMGLRLLIATAGIYLGAVGWELRSKYIRAGSIEAAVSGIKNASLGGMLVAAIWTITESVFLVVILHTLLIMMFFEYFWPQYFLLFENNAPPHIFIGLPLALAYVVSYYKRGGIHAYTSIVICAIMLAAFVRILIEIQESAAFPISQASARAAYGLGHAWFPYVAAGLFGILWLVSISRKSHLREPQNSRAAGHRDNAQSERSGSHDRAAEPIHSVGVSGNGINRHRTFLIGEMVQPVFPEIGMALLGALLVITVMGISSTASPNVESLRGNWLLTLWLRVNVTPALLIAVGLGIGLLDFDIVDCVRRRHIAYGNLLVH